MKDYHYGAMKNPDVLTDYYARRHTSQFRLHFATLADDYLSRYDKELQLKKQIDQNVAALRAMGRNAEAEEQLKSMPTLSNPTENKRRAIALINKSLEEMPAEIVIDYGEPSGSRDTYTTEGGQLQAYQDGILHDYVGIYFKAGDKKAANKLGMTVLSQLSSVLGYFENSHGKYAANNVQDLNSALDGIFKMHIIASDPIEGDPNGQLAQESKKILDNFYKKTLPKLLKDIEEMAVNNGESIRRAGKLGNYASQYYRLKDYAEGVAINYGFMQGATPQANPNMDQMNLEQLMQQMPKQDSVIQ
jgi:hypothetical protein